MITKDKEPILDAKAMYEFCKSDTHGINFMYTSKEEMDSVRENLSERFDDVFAVPGTRSFHQFTPLGECSVGAKRCSKDKEYADS